MDELVFVSDVSPYVGQDGEVEIAGIHQSLTSAAIAFCEIAGLCSLKFRECRSVECLDLATLESTRLLVLFTIGETPWSAAQRQVIEDRSIRGELGILGVHAATDSAYSWPGFGDLIGGRFDGHPVTGDLPIVVVDREHPATSHLPSPWRFKEELYLFRELASDVHILLGVEFGTSDAASRTVCPVAWCIERERFRSFYTVLGHFVAAYEDVNYLRHLLGAARWVLNNHG